MADKKLDARSRKLRSFVVDALKSNGGGHIGSSMSTIEILRVLYDSVLKFDASLPKISRVGIPDKFATEYGSQSSLLKHWGITSDNLVTAMMKKLGG